MKQQSMDLIENIVNPIAEKYPAATMPERIAPSLLAHFNSMNVNVMLDLYEQDAVLVDARGVPGKDASRSAKSF